MGRKQGFRRRMGRTPLGRQLLILVTFVVLVLISALLWRDYRKNRQYRMQKQIETSGRLLELEMQSLELYVRELASFCLQPIYDTEFSSALVSRSGLTSSQQSYIRSQLAAYYYQRTDLNSYELYLCREGVSFIRKGSAQHFTLLQESTIAEEPGFAQSAAGTYFNAVMPSESGDGFFTYYQSLIRVSDRTQEAVVKLETDTSYAVSLNDAHEKNGEFICILNRDGDLLYSGDAKLNTENAEELLRVFAGAADEGETGAETAEDPEETEAAGESADGGGETSGAALDGSRIVSLEDGSYLAVACTGDKYGLTLISFLPLSAINEELNGVLRSNLLFGGAAWGAAAVLLWLLLGLAIRPVTALSGRMKQAGEGNFQPIEDQSWSLEAASFTDSYNEMVSRIDALIRQNYLSEIDEKTARLTALEAQLNPHFLYNTLQAIGTEALINDQPQINEMITSLAANLRYSIKSGDLVPLRMEMTYVRNYVKLQKMRLEERLQVAIDVPETLLEDLVPKISIQPLVENAILHGMGPDSDRIAIRVYAEREDRQIRITVEDDGCGISGEQLDRMREDFQHFLQPGTAGKIGLANLYSRLQLLYQGEAEMEMESRPGKGTRITMRLPERREDGRTPDPGERGAERTKP